MFFFVAPSVGGAALLDWPALDDCAAGEVAEVARAGAEERASWASIAVMHADSSSQKGFNCLCKSSTCTAPPPLQNADAGAVAIARFPHRPKTLCIVTRASRQKNLVARALSVRCGVRVCMRVKSTSIDKVVVVSVNYITTKMEGRTATPGRESRRSKTESLYHKTTTAAQLRKIRILEKLYATHVQSLTKSNKRNNPSRGNPGRIHTPPNHQISW